MFSLSGLFNRSEASRSLSVGTTCGLESIKGRNEILHRLISSYNFETVLDVGCGYGDFFKFLEDQGVSVEGVGSDFLVAPKVSQKNFKYIQGDFLHEDCFGTYDLIFSSHVVEHVGNTEDFLKKFFACAKNGGVFCLIWPPPKKNVVGGHLHNFNMGLMLYNLVRCGVDCRDVEMLRSGYNLCIMGEFKSFVVPELTSNRYELELLKDWFPVPVAHNFNGDLSRYIEKL